MRRCSAGCLAGRGIFTCPSMGGFTWPMKNDEGAPHALPTITTSSSTPTKISIFIFFFWWGRICWRLYFFFHDGILHHWSKVFVFWKLPPFCITRMGNFLIQTGLHTISSTSYFLFWLDLIWSIFRRTNSNKYLIQSFGCSRSVIFKKQINYTIVSSSTLW